MKKQQQRIALVGLSASGKSSVSRALAAKLGWSLYDTDQIIEQIAGQSIPEIFASAGESHFRDLETKALQIALSEPTRVIATGGGAILRVTNRQLLQHLALVVWLDAPTDVLIARLRSHDEERPLLSGDDPSGRLEALRQVRGPLYHEVADLHIDTSLATTAQIASQIMAALG